MQSTARPAVKTLVGYNRQVLERSNIKFCGYFYDFVLVLLLLLLMLCASSLHPVTIQVLTMLR